MNATVQALVVAAVVAWAMAYAAVKLMPKAWRLSVAAHAADLALKAGLSGVAARRVEAKLATGGACGSCDSCKACATPQPADSPTSTTMRTIPIRRA